MYKDCIYQWLMVLSPGSMNAYQIWTCQVRQSHLKHCQNRYLHVPHDDRETNESGVQGERGRKGARNFRNTGSALNFMCSEHKVVCEHKVECVFHYSTFCSHTFCNHALWRISSPWEYKRRSLLWCVILVCPHHFPMVLPVIKVPHNTIVICLDHHAHSSFMQ